MQNVLLWEDLPRVADAMDERVFRYIEEGQTESFEAFDSYDLLAFDWYDIHSVSTDCNKITVYLDEEDLLFFCESEASRRYIHSEFERLSQDSENSNEQLLYRFFRRLLHGNMDYLDELEGAINDGETQLLAGKSKEALAQIIFWRHELLRLKHYYEQLDTIFDEMMVSDNRLLSDVALQRLIILGHRTDRFLAKVSDLQEMVSHLREAYQSQLSIQQNELMKVFTIVTVIFLPLTLLTGWFGMNFSNMPELHLPWAYPALIGVSIAIVAGLLWLFKHKKWL